MSHVLNAVTQNLPPCEACGALQGDPCRTPGWKTRAPHRGRGGTRLTKKSKTKKSVKAAEPAEPTVTIELTVGELETVLGALDSHRYWQLSDEHYRDDGFVEEPGSDDPDNAKELLLVDALEARLQRVLES